MTGKSLRPEDKSIVIKVRGVDSLSDCYRQLDKCFSKKEPYRQPDIVYVSAMGTVIPRAVEVVELLKMDHCDVNVVYTAIGSHMSNYKTWRKPDGSVSRIVIGLSKKDLKPQYEFLEPVTPDSKKKAFESIEIVV